MLKMIFLVISLLTFASNAFSITYKCHMQPHQPLDERMGLIEVDFGYESVVIRAKEWIHGKYNRTYKERRDGNISFAGWSSSMNRHHVDITMPISAARGVHKIKVELGVEPQNIYAGRDFAFFSCIRIR